MAPGAVRKLMSKTQNGSSKGSQCTATNRTYESDHMPQNPTIPSTQSRSTNQNSKRYQRMTTNQTYETDNSTQNVGAPASHTPEIPLTETSEIPSTETSEIPSNESLQHPSPEASDTTATGSKKRGRGQTMGKGIMKYFAASGNKMKITVDPVIGRPINGDESAKLSSQIGVLARDVLLVPKKWKEVDEGNGLEPCFDHLKIHMDVNVDAPGVRQSLVDRLKISSRQKRHKLHLHFKTFATLEEAKNNKPSFCPSKENWEALCEYFATAKFKHTSDVNSANRKKLRAPHISGRTAFTVRRHEISQNELNGEPCDRIELYKRTHYTEKDGWSSDEARENWELMIKLREQYKEEGIEKSSDEIVFEVLGEGSGYIKGLGYGPKPPSRRNTSYESSTQKLQKDLQETQEKLQDSESQVNELKTQVVEFENEVTGLKSQLSQQGANINKLMEFLASKGIDL